MNIGIYAYALAAIAAGIVDLVWGRLDPAHQPLQAWGDNVPGQTIITYALAVALVIGGAAMILTRTRRIGAIVLAAAYVATAIFWLPRFYTAPQFLGHSPVVYLGILSGVCQELFVAAAALVVLMGSRPSPLLRWIFGISSACFGVVHLTGIAANTSYVPGWMPFGQPFWVVFTGVAFILAGIAIVSGVLDVLAARLLALMWLIFSACTLLPGLAANPHSEVSWGGNAYNILIAASAWILAAWLAHKSSIGAARILRRWTQRYASQR